MVTDGRRGEGWSGGEGSVVEEGGRGEGGDGVCEGRGRLVVEGVVGEVAAGEKGGVT